MQQRVFQSSNSFVSSTNSLKVLDTNDSDLITSNHMRISSSFSNGLGGASRRTKRPSSSVKRKPSSLINALYWALIMTVVFIALVNYVHILKEQGKLPSGVKLTLQYNKNRADVNSSKQFFFGRHGNYYYQPILSDMAASKSRFLQKDDRSKRAKANQTAYNFHYTPLLKIRKHPNATQRQNGARKGEQSQLQIARKQQQANDEGPKTAKAADESPLHRLDYYFQISKRENHDKERILELIRDNASIEHISEATYELLPTWSQVTSMYGNGPKVNGLDQCTTFQGYGDIGNKFLAVSGMFNSGTNLLAKILVRNCVLHHKQEKYGSKHRGVRWQVPWGKHTPPKDEAFRLSHVAKKSEGVDAKQVLPAVTIRDPFRWLQSMCSNSYASRWPRPFKRHHPHYHCPNLVPTEQEKIRLAQNGFEPIVEGSQMEKETEGGDEDADVENNNGNLNAAEEVDNGDYSNHTDDEQQEDFNERKDAANADLNLHYFPVSVSYSNFTRHHRSLVHLWNEWYKEYLDLENYPRVLVRMEDLLFFPDQAIPSICECAGGKIFTKKDQHNQTHIKVIAESAKLKSVKTRPGQEHTGYLDALIRYGNPNTRSRGLTHQDLQYARQYLDPGLLNLFGYEFPEILSS